MVMLRGGITKPMFEISIGEEVAVWTEKGDLEYDHVYAHGHLDGEALSEFIALKLSRLQVENETRTLELTADHFAIILTPHSTIANAGKGINVLTYKRARDIQVGDAMLGLTRDLTYSPFYVIEAKKKVLKGLYNPYTLRGTIIVNNMLASCHSKWFLESTFDRLHLSHLLPSIYQAILLPVRILYRRMGKDSYTSLYENFDSCFDIAKSSTYASGYFKLVVMGLLPYPSINNFSKKDIILEGNMIKMLPK
eukprot:c22590_g1_i2 orf=882-1634(+)